MEVKINKNHVTRGIRAFATLTIIGIAVIFYFTGSKQTWASLQKFRFDYFLLTCFLVLIDLTTGALRIHIFIRKIRPEKSFVASFQANLANIFLAAATPFQTGGGLAQLYVLNRHGVPYAAGLTVGVLNFVATLLVLFAAGTVILTTLPGQFTINHSLFVVLDVSRFTFYATLFLVVLFMIRPQWLGYLIRLCLASLGRWFSAKREKFDRISQKVVGFIERYQGYMLYYWRNDKLALVGNVFLTIVLFFNKCLIAYVIFLGLGLHPDFWQVIMLQMLVVFLLYFAPTPGASLIAETGTSAIMSLVAPGYLLSIFSVLWRFFTTYFGVALGSIVLIRAIGEKRAPGAGSKGNYQVPPGKTVRRNSIPPK